MKFEVFTTSLNSSRILLKFYSRSYLLIYFTAISSLKGILIAFIGSIFLKEFLLTHPLTALTSFISGSSGNLPESYVLPRRHFKLFPSFIEEEEPSAFLELGIGDNRLRGSAS
jgi:hypothetical protein